MNCVTTSGKVRKQVCDQLQRVGRGTEDVSSSKYRYESGAHRRWSSGASWRDSGGRGVYRDDSSSLQALLSVMRHWWGDTVC